MGTAECIGRRETIRSPHVDPLQKAACGVVVDDDIHSPNQDENQVWFGFLPEPLGAEVCNHVVGTPGESVWSVIHAEVCNHVVGTPGESVVVSHSCRP